MRAAANLSLTEVSGRDATPTASAPSRIALDTGGPLSWSRNIYADRPRGAGQVFGQGLPLGGMKNAQRWGWAALKLSASGCLYTVGQSAASLSVGYFVLDLLEEHDANAVSVDKPAVAITGLQSPSAVTSDAPEVSSLTTVLAANSRAKAILRGLSLPQNLLDDAIQIVDSATAAYVPVPRPVLTADGEVMFYGRRGRVYLDLGLRGDGKYSFFCRDAAGREFMTDEDRDLNSGLDEDVCRVIRELA